MIKKFNDYINESNSDESYLDDLTVVKEMPLSKLFPSSVLVILFDNGSIVEYYPYNTKVYNTREDYKEETGMGDEEINMIDSLHDPEIEKAVSDFYQERGMTVKGLKVMDK